jgi:hypothetical protein
MTTHTLREVSAPYTVNPDDEAVGRDTIIITRNGVPVAAVVPYAEYQEWLAEKAIRAGQPPIESALPIDPEFRKQWEAFQKLKPELLKKYPGQWVAIVNEQVVEVGPDFSTVAERMDRFGDVPMCISQVLDKPRIYKLPTRKVIRHAD